MPSVASRRHPSTAACATRCSPAAARRPRTRDAVEWAREATERGAGEILLTSIDRDGTKAGFDCEMTAAVSDAVNIPVIASGGAGTFEHFADVFRDGHADAALAASIFHFNEKSVSELKRFLSNAGHSGENLSCLTVRLCLTPGSRLTPYADSVD